MVSQTRSLRNKCKNGISRVAFSQIQRKSSTINAMQWRELLSWFSRVKRTISRTCWISWWKRWSKSSSRRRRKISSSDCSYSSWPEFFSSDSISRHWLKHWGNCGHISSTSSSVSSRSNKKVELLAKKKLISQLKLSSWSSCFHLWISKISRWTNGFSSLMATAWRKKIQLSIIQWLAKETTRWKFRSKVNQQEWACWERHQNQ